MSALGDTVGGTLAVMSCGYARTGVRRSGATARAAEQGVGITEGQGGGVGGDAVVRWVRSRRTEALV